MSESSICSAHELSAPAVPVRKTHRSASIHYWVTLALVIAAVPILRSTGLPFRFAWTDYIWKYWGLFVLESLVGGLILYIADAPFKESIGPFLRRYSKQKLRFVFFLPLVLILMLTLGVRVGLLASFATAVLIEVKDRVEENRVDLVRIASNIFLAVAYLFVAGVIISVYNDAIAVSRYNGAAELVLKHWDSVILRGHSISDLAHGVIRRWPGIVPWMELIYFGTFAQTGGCLAILAFTEGRRRTLQFAGTLLMAFYIALVCFYLWPATGPYASCVTHFSAVPGDPVIYQLQKMVLILLEKARTGSLGVIGADYYIALPSMHFAQTLIALWFLRRRKRLAILLVTYDVLLAVAILVLENHYLVDLLAAIPVAALAIALTGRDTHALTESPAFLGNPSSKTLRES